MKQFKVQSLKSKVGEGRTMSAPSGVPAVRLGRGRRKMRFKDLLLIDFLTGLAVSGKHFPKKKFTVQYPEKRLAPSPRFRGMFRLDISNCLGCSMCANSCPIRIIHMETHDETDADGKRKRVLDRFDIDLKRCMFCGLCVEKCPQGHTMLAMDTGEYELATCERNMELYL